MRMTMANVPAPVDFQIMAGGVKVGPFGVAVFVAVVGLSIFRFKTCLLFMFKTCLLFMTQPSE